MRCEYVNKSAEDIAPGEKSCSGGKHWLLPTYPEVEYLVDI
jgi:hypothetical protein